MLYYADGQVIRFGDLVDLGGTLAIVTNLIETKYHMESSGAKEPAVCFRTKEHGEFYKSMRDPAWDESIVLLNRAGTGGRGAFEFEPKGEME